MSWLERLTGLRGVVRGMGFEKERAAVALLPLGFFVSLYTVVAFTAPPTWAPAFGALALCYLTAFLAVASQWFWGRWFASGLGWSGLMVGLASLVHPDIGWNPMLATYTALHAVIIATLIGSRMASRYELQPAWRERFAMDEYGVARLGKAVTRASASLPTLILWALAPRTGQGIEIAAALFFLIGACGVAGMLRLRTWGAIALGLTGVAMAVAWMFLPGPRALTEADAGILSFWSTLTSPGVTLGLVAWALLPLARPAWRFLAGPAAGASGSSGRL
jgi:hypothetical protein